MSETPDPTLPQNPPTNNRPAMDELWRRALGRQLRELRLGRGERLDDTAARAGISPQYLSEIERGRKDASSEMIAAVIGALESSLADVLTRVAEALNATSGELIDIRSVIRLNRPASAPARPTPGTAQRRQGHIEASLSIAA